MWSYVYNYTYIITYMSIYICIDMNWHTQYTHCRLYCPLWLPLCVCIHMLYCIRRSSTVYIFSFQDSIGGGRALMVSCIRFQRVSQLPYLQALALPFFSTVQSHHCRWVWWRREHTTKSQNFETAMASSKSKCIIQASTWNKLKLQWTSALVSIRITCNPTFPVRRWRRLCPLSDLGPACASSIMSCFRVTLSLMFHPRSSILRQCGPNWKLRGPNQITIPMDSVGTFRL